MRQSLADWLLERRKGIGGSDVAAVLSEGYGCPRALFLDKSGVEPDYQHTEAELGLFERGHALEPLIARKFAQETGLKVRNMPTRVSTERPWMRVNVDRMIHSLDDGMGPGYLECKTANQHVFTNMLEEGMPPHYILQVQHGLAVTGWKWGYFAVLEPYTFGFLHFRYERNEKLINEVILPFEDSFWKRVRAGDIPDRLPDFNDSRCEKCVYRRGCRNAEALPAKKAVKKAYEPVHDEVFDILVGNIKLLDARVKDAEAALQLEREKLRVAMGERTAILVPSQGKKVSFDWQNGSSRWDTRALDAEQKHLAEKYKRRSEPHRVLRMYDAAEIQGRSEAMQEVA